MDTKLLTDRRTDRQTDGQTCEHKVFPNTLDDLKKNWGSNSLDKIFHHLAHDMWVVTMATPGLVTVEKMCYADWPCDKHLLWIPRELSEYWGSSFATKDFPLYFAQISLPWQCTFCHCQNMRFAHWHLQTNICAKFHEKWSISEGGVRDTRVVPILSIICC